MAKRKIDWAAYDQSLKQRGSITFWFSDEAIKAWSAESSGNPGGQAKFSNLVKGAVPAICDSLKKRTRYTFATHYILAF